VKCEKMQLPLRQKIALGLTVIIGFFILFAYNVEIIEPETLKWVIIFYLLGVPFSLLCHDELLIDLNNNRIFNIWLIIGLVFLGIYFVVRDMGDVWIGGLRTLLCFLIAYKILNTIMKKTTGNYIINAMANPYDWNFLKHFDKIDETAGRTWTVTDLAFNFLLFVVIPLSMFAEMLYKALFPDC